MHSCDTEKRVVRGVEKGGGTGAQVREKKEGSKKKKKKKKKKNTCRKPQREQERIATKTNMTTNNRHQ
jgi:hypothetical protein